MYKDIIIGIFCGVIILIVIFITITVLNKFRTSENILKDFAKSKEVILKEYNETTEEINIKFIKEIKIKKGND